MPNLNRPDMYYATGVVTTIDNLFVDNWSEYKVNFPVSPTGPTDFEIYNCHFCGNNYDKWQDSCPGCGGRRFHKIIKRATRE